MEPVSPGDPPRQPSPHRPEPQRPEPDGTAQWRSTIAAWVTWLGLGRLVASAAAVLVVCAGVFWLLRTAPPPTEAGLPMATSVPPASTVAESTAPTPTTIGGTVSVHVAGAVDRAGVYELEAGSRVQAAIAAAGGATSEADPDTLNLAAELVDGTRVYVPVVGESVPIDPGITSEPAPGAGPAGPVDVNRATATELDVLPGVGPATAAAIVAERDRNGPFLTVDDLARVRGIGPSKLEALAGLVTT